MSARSFLRDDAGSPSAEFVLMLPFLLVLLFGGFEAGHFVWTQHKLTEGVREGVRYASRLPVEKFCDKTTGALTLDAGAEANIKAVTVSGVLPAGDGALAAPARVRGWTTGQVNVELWCDADGYVNTGIYTQLGQGGPIVRVSATDVTYPSLFEQLGVLTSSIKLTAKSNAAVIGV